MHLSLIHICYQYLKYNAAHARHIKLSCSDSVDYQMCIRDRLIVSEEFMKELTDEQQQIIREAAETAKQYAREPVSYTHLECLA